MNWLTVLGVYLFLGLLVDGIVVYAIVKYKMQNHNGIGCVPLVTPFVWPAIGVAMLLSFLDDNRKDKDVNRKNAD